MTTLRSGIVLASFVLALGCGKKDDSASGSKSEATPSAKSGLPWTPAGYEKLSETCKKALACCEEVAKADGAKSADDFNLKCSGPATWKDGECDVDMKARVAALEAAGKPVIDACK